MKTEVIIALTASGASIIVAIISLIGSRLNSKKLFEIEKKRSKYHIYDENLNNNFSALGILISQIQGFKDYLLFTVNSITNSLDSSTVLTEIKDLKNKMVKVYEENSHYFDNDILNAAHSAKNYIMNIEVEFEKLLLERKYINLSDEEKQHIRNNIIQLTDYQNTLRDSRFKILSEVS